MLDDIGRPGRTDDAEAAFLAAFEAAEAGTAVIYHVGHLVEDRERDLALGRVASKAYRLGRGTDEIVSVERQGGLRRELRGLGRGYLTQRRVGEARFEYRITKAGPQATRRRTRAGAGATHGGRRRGQMA
jgi:hypothetical protein